MKKTDQKKMVDYWRETAEHDYGTMRALFKSKRYDASLFFGHLILEKILKALVVKETKEPAPYTHHLVRLSEISETILDENELDLLGTVNEFNIDARYPEEKLAFYKHCTKEYATKFKNDIIVLYRKLCQQLKQKK